MPSSRLLWLHQPVLESRCAASPGQRDDGFLQRMVAVLMLGPKRAVPLSSCVSSCEFSNTTHMASPARPSAIICNTTFSAHHNGRQPAHANPEPLEYDTTCFQQHQELGWGTGWRVLETQKQTATLAGPEAWLCLALVMLPNHIDSWNKTSRSNARPLVRNKNARTRFLT